MDKEDSFEAGYKKPPQKTQFVRGQSGNPKGRPKGSKNVNTIVRKVIRQRVKVKGEQGTRSITKVEAAYTQLLNLAAAGNLAAFRELARLLHTYADPIEDAAPPFMRLCDEVVMKSMIKRIREAQDPDPTPELEISTKSEDAE